MMGLFGIFLILGMLHTHISHWCLLLRSMFPDLLLISKPCYLCYHYWIACIFLLLCVLILYQQNDLQIVPSILSIDCFCLVAAFFSILSITILLTYTYLLACALGSHLGNPYGNKRHKDLSCFLLVIL